MDSDREFLIPLHTAQACDESLVGGKAANLARLLQNGFNVPNGFCLTTHAYESFVHDKEITTAIRMELGRKPMDEMRWEEIWDTALRIRGMFLADCLPASLRESIAVGLANLDPGVSLAVRSSGIGEDSGGRSFAGLHESIIGVREEQDVEKAVRLVWASLWSDAALLYRKELGLDPAKSKMAVVVQEMVDANRSGVAFARDPRDANRGNAIIEAVPGPCNLLVDGVVDPDRWELDRETHAVVAWLPGQRDDEESEEPVLEQRDLVEILETLLTVEQLFRWAPDMEWTGRGDSLTVLQARPITTAAPDENDDRNWYLSLRPGDARLKQLRERVVNQLIPELTAEGEALADENLESLDDQQLADAIDVRRQAVEKWKKIYWDDFIPFAHGVRRLATYYNDAVQPVDPYEFVGLLRDKPLLAGQRNDAIAALADSLGADDQLRKAIEVLLAKFAGALDWSVFRDQLVQTSDAAIAFVKTYEDLNNQYFDIAYDGKRLHDSPESLLKNLVELSQKAEGTKKNDKGPMNSISVLRQRLLDAVGLDRREEAIEVIETGRVSWKLRDDDNLLVARLDSQLLRALETAEIRLRDQGRLIGDGSASAGDAKSVASALRTPSDEVELSHKAATANEKTASDSELGESPRQLIGQPASPGTATGMVRCIRGRDDLGKFRKGEVLVCDAIQPTMTHLVPLAIAIVERRGGMLIHGAIIARELAIPCVNGVRKAGDILRDGDLVTVDGHLGIVTVGEAEFNLELQPISS